MKEDQLFYPLKIWLEGQGYAVHSEVKYCDLVARKGSDMIIVETKLRLNLQLVFQAVQRQEICDSVYMAVPLMKARSYPSNFSAVKRLLRRLGLGLIFIRFLKTKTNIEIILHPVAPRHVKHPSKQKSIIRELNGRYAEFNRSGEPVKVEKITAYKQQSLYIAHILAGLDSASPAELHRRGLPAKTGSILLRNIYGWFLHPARGQYALSEVGYQALKVYHKILVRILEER